MKNTLRVVLIVKLTGCFYLQARWVEGLRGEQCGPAADFRL